jgi:hypothetical protein
MKFYGSGKDTTIVFDHTSNAQIFRIYPEFEIDSVKFDPEQWIISADNMVTLERKTEVVTMYPNPVTDFLRISIPENNLEDFAVFDCPGRSVNLSYKQEGTGISIDVRELKAGMYFIQVKMGGVYKLIKFIRR